MPGGVATTRFSIEPSSATRIASARPDFETHEFDMFQPRVGLGGQHDAGAPSHFGQQARGLGERAFESAPLRRRPHLIVDARALLAPQIPELQKRVDEQPEALLGRQTSGAGVRRVNEPKLFQVLHHVANRRRRQRHRQHARQMAGADGFAGGQIGVDDIAENLARAGVERRQHARLGGTFRRGGHAGRMAGTQARAQGDDGPGTAIEKSNVNCQTWGKRPTGRREGGRGFAIGRTNPHRPTCRTRRRARLLRPGRILSWPPSTQ